MNRVIVTAVSQVDGVSEPGHSNSSTSGGWGEGHSKQTFNKKIFIDSIIF